MTKNKSMIVEHQCCTT